MKRIFFPMIAMIICFQSFAQNKKGYCIVGTSIGSTGYSTGSSESSNSSSSTVTKTDNNSFYLSINPYMGKYVTDNIVVGAGLTLAPYSSKSTVTGSYESKFSYFLIQIGPFARFYFGDKNSKGSPFIQVNTGLNFYPGYKSTFAPSSRTVYTATYDKYICCYT